MALMVIPPSKLLFKRSHYIKRMVVIIILCMMCGIGYADVSNSITLITREEIVKSGARDLGELLDAYPFVSVMRSGYAGSLSSLSMRGSTAKQVLVLIDGRPVNDSDFETEDAYINDIAAGTVQPQQILLSHIERVEIIRGGASSLYGANAVGGVVNLITQKAHSEIPITDISVKYNSFNTKMYNLGLGVKKNNADIYISGDRHASDGYRKNEDINVDHVFARAGYDMKSLGTVSITGDIYLNKLGLPGSNTTPVNQWNSTIEKIASTPNNRWKTDNRYGVLEHKIPLGNKISLRTRLFGSLDEKKFYYTTSFLDTVHETKSMGTEVQLDIPGTFTAGGEYMHNYFFQKFIVSNRQISETKYINRAVYINKTMRSGNWNMLPGIRVDNNSKFDNHVNPSLLITFQSENTWLLSALAARSYRTPTNNEIITEASLHPEKGMSYDIGLKTMTDTMRTEITFFLTDTTDRIMWQPDIVTFTWKPKNIKGTTRSQGIECNYTHTVAACVKHSISYIYNSVKMRETDTTIFYKPAHTIYYSLEIFNNKGSQLMFNARGVGKQYTNQSATESIPGYGLLDIKFSQTIHTLILSFGMDNALNKRYLNRKNYPLAGRTIYGSVSAKFFD